MSPRARVAAWTAGAFGTGVALVAAVLVLLGSGLAAEDAGAYGRIVEARGPLLAFLALVFLIACLGLARAAHARLLDPLRRLADQALIVASTSADRPIEVEGAAEVRHLARAVERLAEARRTERGAFEARAAESNARLEEERNRLAALMSELSEGVIVCNRQGRILLYNEQARVLFAPAPGAASQAPVGLGRTVFGVLDRDQVTHAVDKLQHGLDRGDPAPSTVFFAARPGGDLVRVKVAPSLDPDRGIGGLVLTCEDATRAYGEEHRRRTLLQSLATRVRAPAANVRAAAENLTTFPDMPEPQRARFTEIIAAESRLLSDTLDEALRGYADALRSGATLEEMPLADLLAVVRRGLESLPGLALREVPQPATWVRVDTLAVAQAMVSIAQRLRDELGVHEVALRAGDAAGFAEIDLAWHGAPLSLESLAAWTAQSVPVAAGPAPLAIGEVLERHGGEAWPQSDAATGTSWVRFLIPLAATPPARARRAPAVGSRPEYYDFDLFGLAGAARGLLGERLAALSYTVFDTETTGVAPSAGDRIISIGAVRIVNGRILKNEAFEQLVDPQRPLPRESVRIHGIPPEALVGQPTLREVLPGFHRFCEDTVLVAHNAAFDMRFLELAEAESGVRFRQPVLDTLLLSAAAHPHLQEHSLEAIAARLGIAVVGRHTAMGDALMTAEIFMRLVPLLAELGIQTLGEALEASRETYYVRLQY